MKKLTYRAVRYAWFLPLALALSGFIAPVYAADSGVAASPSNSPPKTGRDVWGNPEGTDVQGNANDKNGQGNRPKDVWGNPPKDIYGNKIGTENK